MKRTEVETLDDNFIRIIGKEWMLVTAGTKEQFNMMTANWGGVGYLWNKRVAFIFVRPERYTYKFIEEQPYFTLSFMGDEYKEVHKICGSRSGRDIDKTAATGLTPVTTGNGAVTFAESRLVLECRKLYAAPIKQADFLVPGIYEKWYGEAHGSDHTMYIAEITDAWVQ